MLKMKKGTVLLVLGAIAVVTVLTIAKENKDSEPVE